MREILFRGKRLDNDDWVYGLLCRVGDTYANIVRKDTGVLYSVLTNTIGQCTGLTDKNGKKIFEGDICQIKEHGDVDLAVISFEHGAFYATPHNANIHEHTLWDIWYNDYDIEVNGNIHDNPELLEEKK